MITRSSYLQLIFEAASRVALCAGFTFGNRIDAGVVALNMLGYFSSGSEEEHFLRLQDCNPGSVTRRVNIPIYYARFGGNGRFFRESSLFGVQKKVSRPPRRRRKKVDQGWQQRSFISAKKLKRIQEIDGRRQKNK